MTSKGINNLLLLGCYILVLSLTLLNINNSFFCDTVQLGSLHANYYFSNHFSNILLPNSMDSGHIPVFGMYIAVLWKIFGKTLIVSHLAILPFALGIVYQLHKLCVKFISPKYVGIALLLILIDPTLLSQMTLISPDVPLIFFFFLGMNAVLENRKWILAFSILLLFMTSMRGMMVSLCLLSLDLYCNVDFKTKIKTLFLNLTKRSLIYIPALILFVSYSLYHYSAKGWIGYHEDSPWAKCFETVDFNGFIYNIATYGWRVLDFGRIGIWIVFFTLLIKYSKEILKEKQIQLLFFFVIFLMIVLPLNMLWAKNLLGHRYLMPIYLSFALLCATILFSSYVKESLKYGLSIFWFLILVSGNFWIYPDKIAKGWDATLAHLPYYNLRNQAIQYLDHEAIDFKDVQSFFPNTQSLDIIDLKNDSRNFNNFDAKSKYVFYSNIFNIDDETYNKITNPEEYIMMKHFENNGVFIIIYKKIKS